MTSGSGLARASLCAAVDDADEVAALARWLRAARSSLAYVSGNHGCGCCVHVFDVEGHADLLATIPAALRASSDWVEHGKRTDTEMGPSLEALLLDHDDPA